MTEPERPGLDEAIEAAAARLDGYSDEIEAQAVVRAAYPIIRAGVLAEAEAAILAQRDKAHCEADGEYAFMLSVTAVRALGGKP